LGPLKKDSKKLMGTIPFFSYPLRVLSQNKYKFLSKLREVRNIIKRKIEG